MLGNAVAGVSQAAAQHARVELLARQNSVSAGSDVQVGVHFILEPGWHIYWVNPGDSGQPPSFKWRFPPGFRAGEIQWPRPGRGQPNKTLTHYGYHNEDLVPLSIINPSRPRKPVSVWSVV